MLVDYNLSVRREDPKEHQELLIKSDAIEIQMDYEMYQLMNAIITNEVE
jgi:hypothetical protein